MEPRPYQPSDRAACLAVFDSNGLSAREPFERFLDDPANFTVLEHDGSIAGCGGYSIALGGAAVLVHGMIRRDLQGIGLGRFLLLFRLRQISKSASEIRFARLSTTQELAGFYQKQGFKPASAASGGVVELVMKLAVCA